MAGLLQAARTPSGHLQAPQGPPAAADLWRELCIGCWPQLGQREAHLRNYIERNASRAERVNVFGDQLPADHLRKTLAACKGLQSLDMFQVDCTELVDEVTGGLALSGAQPTEAGVHACALSAQLPCSVTDLTIGPRWRNVDDADEGWGWYQQGLAMEGVPGLAGWVVHR